MRDFITQNVQWKLFSLALAIVIWATVRTVSTESPKAANPLATWDTRSFTNLPVLIVSSAADVREFKVNPDTVDVRVSGSPEIMAALQGSDIRATVDLTGVESTRGVRTRVNVSTPVGVTIVHVSPSDVNVVVPPRKESQSKP